MWNMLSTIVDKLLKLKVYKYNTVCRFGSQMGGSHHKGVMWTRAWGGRQHVWITRPLNLHICEQSVLWLLLPIYCSRAVIFLCVGICVMIEIGTGKRGMCQSSQRTLGTPKDLPAATSWFRCLFLDWFLLLFAGSATVFSEFRLSFL